jgi:competence protein ComGC
MSMWQSDKRGDTIVEVLLSIAIMAQVFIITYSLVNHTLAEGITASEHTQAIKLAESQIESLKFRQSLSSNSVWNTNFAQRGINFCLDDQATDPTNVNWLPITQNTANTPTQLVISANTNNYKLGCVSPQSATNAKFFVNISTSTSALNGITYLITVRWEHIGGGTQNLTQVYYRL